jgi:hypothetical protein
VIIKKIVEGSFIVACSNILLFTDRSWAACFRSHIFNIPVVFESRL